MCLSTKSYKHEYYLISFNIIVNYLSNDIFVKKPTNIVGNTLSQVSLWLFFNINFLLLFRLNRFKTIVYSSINRKDNNDIIPIVFCNTEAIMTRLTCKGRNTDSIVAALGWSGAGATTPPRPLSTPPGNVSCEPANKMKTSQKNYV